MSEERIAYVVTSGSYSDYGIEAVFDNLKAAQAYILPRKDEYEPPKIEQYTLNSTAPRHVTYWHVRIAPNDDGRRPESYERQADTDDWVHARQGYPCAYYWTAKDRIMPDGGYYAEAVALTKEEATKIAHDLLAQLRYEHETNGVTRLPVE